MCGTTATTEWSVFFPENYDLTIHECMALRHWGDFTGAVLVGCSHCCQSLRLPGSEKRCLRSNRDGWSDRCVTHDQWRRPCHGFAAASRTSLHRMSKSRKVLQALRLGQTILRFWSWSAIAVLVEKIVIVGYSHLFLLTTLPPYLLTLFWVQSKSWLQIPAI